MRLRLLPLLLLLLLDLPFLLLVTLFRLQLRLAQVLSRREQLRLHRLPVPLRLLVAWKARSVRPLRLPRQPRKERRVTRRRAMIAKGASRGHGCLLPTTAVATMMTTMTMVATMMRRRTTMMRMRMVMTRTRTRTVRMMRTTAAMRAHRMTTMRIWAGLPRRQRAGTAVMRARCAEQLPPRR